MPENKFDVIFMEEASEFLRELSSQARKKIYYNVAKVKGGVKDSDLFKKLDGSSDFWEFRTLYEGVQYRLLAFWDVESKSLVVVTSGFVKKKWEVPAKEIAKAESLKKKYFEVKRRNRIWKK